MSTSPTLSGYKRPPKYFRFEAKPANASTKDIENAQPIYIDGLPTGDVTLPENTTGESAVLVSDTNGALSWLKVSDLIQPLAGE